MTPPPPLEELRSSRVESGAAAPENMANRSRHERWRRVLWPWLLGACVTVVYAGNLRVATPGDNIPAALLPLALWRGDGFHLDRFREQVRDRERPGEYIYYIVERDGHLLSAYPLGAGLVAAPLMMPALVALDRLDPDWEQERGAPMGVSLWLSKFASAAIGGLIAVALYYLLCRLGFERQATWSVVAAAFGSNLWMIGGQTLWQHGPAALALVCAMLLLSAPQRSVWQLLLAGIATSAAVWCRPTLVIFAVTILLWVVKGEGRRVAWFFAPCLGLGGLLLAYNLTLFGTPLGGAAMLEAAPIHQQEHAVESAWTAAPVEGLLGTLLSPSRGLLVFTPWVAVAVALLPVTRDRLPRGSLVRWLFWALVPLLILNSCYAVWWGGHCFGPRYWTEAMPLFAVMLAMALAWAWPRGLGWRLLIGLATAGAIAVQAIGALCYPSGWEASPRDIDQAHERLWDWRDSELTRSLREGPRPFGVIDY